MAYVEGLKILLVDSDESTVLDYKQLLAEAGHDVEVTTDTSMVGSEVKRGEYSMVVVDVSPPVDPGVALLQDLRAADSDLCVIATTAAPDAGTAVRVLKTGALDYLAKPVPPEELLAVIDQAIREKGLLVDLEMRLNQVVGQRLRALRSGCAGTGTGSGHGWAGAWRVSPWLAWIR